MLLRHYLEQGTSKSAMARRLGVSRDTIHRWIRLAQEPNSRFTMRRAANCKNAPVDKSQFAFRLTTLAAPALRDVSFTYCPFL